MPRQSSLCQFVCAVGLLLMAAPAFSETQPWVIQNPHNPRYLEIAPPNGIPFSIASYGSLVPCLYSGVPDTVAAAVALKNASSPGGGIPGGWYARVWNWWTCDENPDWATNPWKGPWPVDREHTKRYHQWDKDGRYVRTVDLVAPVYDLSRDSEFDTSPWSYLEALRATVDAARNMLDGSNPPARLTVEIALFRDQDVDADNGCRYDDTTKMDTCECHTYPNCPGPGRSAYNPFRKANNNVGFDYQNKGLIKLPYLCDNNQCSPTDQLALEKLRQYVAWTVNNTRRWGNVVYEIYNEPYMECELDNASCLAALAYFPQYWANFIHDTLGTDVRLVASDNWGGYAQNVDEVKIANYHIANGDQHERIQKVLRDTTEAVRNGYFASQPKVTNVDEMGNGEWDPVRLRKKAWSIIASGGHFHIDDPCNPAVLLCDGDPSLNAEPWKPVRNIAAFKNTSGWAFHRAKPVWNGGQSATAYFYWMVQGDPEYDTIGFGPGPTQAAVNDHVGYLALHPDATCSTEALTVDLPAVPAGAPEYVAWLWDPTKPTPDNYLLDSQGKRLEYRFTHPGGVFDWCDTPFKDVILARTLPADDLVFHVRATLNGPVVLTVTKSGTSTGIVRSTYPDTNLNCGAVCSLSYTPGQPVTLVAEPTGTLTRHTAWGGACSDVPPGTPCTVTLDSSKTVTAQFDQEPYSLSVTKTGSGKGSITSDAGVACSAADTTCAWKFAANTVVELTASPLTPGNEFGGWGGDCAAYGTNTTCQVTIDGIKTVTAAFDPQRFALTVTKSGAGMAYATVTSTPAGINCGATCSATFAYGHTVTLSPRLATEKHASFTGWSDACSGKGDCEVTLTGSTSVTATYGFVNQAPTCVANNGGSYTVLSYDWTVPIPLTIADPDGDVIATCDHIGSSFPHRISIGAYQRCQVGPPPAFKFRPVCANTPTVADVMVYVKDQFGAQGVCRMNTQCPY